MSDMLDHLISRAEYGTRARTTLRLLGELHHPVDRAGPTAQGCGSCVAGYDPATGQLVYCAWPCPSARIMQAREDG